MRQKSIVINGVGLLAEYDFQPREKDSRNEPGCEENCSVFKLTAEHEDDNLLDLWEEAFKWGVRQGIKKANSKMNNDFEYTPNPYDHIEMKILEK